MDALTELCRVCQLVNTDKVTERKKQTDKLIATLKVADVRKALDRNSEQKTSKNRATVHHSGTLFGWHDLFKVVKVVMAKDVEVLLKSRSGRGGGAVPPRRRKDDICSLFKMVVRLASKGGWLKATDVVSHILEIMAVDGVRETYGTDLSKVLIRDVLGVRKSWCQLSSKHWSQLLYLYCVLLTDASSGLDHGVLAEVIHTIVVGACEQSDVRVKKIFPLLLDYFSRIKEEPSAHVLEYVVSSVNLLSRSIAINGRVQVSQLGENIFIPLLYLWRNQHNDRLKDEIVNFMLLQMSVHHPHGARTEEEGAFALNPDLWKDHLRKLYEMVYTELEEFGDRSRFVTSGRESRQTELKVNLVELAVDVCHQLFTDNISMIEVTQNSFVNGEFGSAAKKRRIDSGWEVIRDVIATTGPQPQVTPWLQLLTRLLEKYPSELPTEQLPLVLGTLQQLLVDGKRRDVERWVLRSLLSLAHCLRQSCVRGHVGEQCLHLWQKVYLATIRLLSLQHTREEGFHLLSTLLQDQLVTPTCEVWSLFIPDLCPRSEAGVQFLTSYLAGHDLTEDYHPNLLVTVETPGSGYPLRLQLLDWMLPSGDDLGEGRVVQVSNGISDWTLFAETLVALTERDTHSIETRKGETRKCGASETGQEELAKIEASYLWISFDLPLDGATVHRQPVKRSECSSRGSHLGIVRKRLEELLQRDATPLLNVYEPDIKQLEQISAQCCLLVKCLYSMLCHGLLTNHQLEQSPLFDPAKGLMKRLATALTDLLRKDGPGGFAKVIATLTQLYNWPEDTSVVHQMAELTRSITPAKLITQLLTIASNEVLTIASNEPATPSRGIPQAGSRITTDLDDDFEFCGAADGNGGFEDFNNTDFDVPVTNSHTTAGCESPVSDALLSDRDQLRLDVVRLLCSWCSPEGDTPLASSSGGGSLTPAGVKRQLLDQLDEEKGWDPTRPFDLQLMACLVTELFHPSHSVSEEETSAVLTALWFVFRTHRNDQRVCQVALQLLCRLVPHLGGEGEMVSSTLRDARDTALHTLQVFRTLSRQGQCVNETRMGVAKCLYSFIQCDPESTWTIWKQDHGGSGDHGEDPLLRELPHLLKDPHPSTRLSATTALQMLFSRSTVEGLWPRDCHMQNEMFELVYAALKDVIVAEGRRSPDEQRDETTNRRSSVLHTLASVARVSAVCEKRAVLVICEMVRDHHIDTELVQKESCVVFAEVLRQVCTSNGYNSLERFTLAHLPYLIDHWLLNDHKISDFPCQLFGYRRLVDFYKVHYTTVVPFLVMRKDTAAAKNVAETISSEWRPLLEACLPKVLVHILPLFAVSKCGKAASERSMQARVAHATTCYDSLLEVVKQENIDKCVVTHRDDIVVDLLLTLHETKVSVDRFARDYDPLPNPPQFDTDTIITTLDYLTKGHGGSVKSLVELLSKSQDSIQNILLALKRHLVSVHCLHEKCRVLRMYRLFVGLLLREFHLQLGGSWAFVLRDVVYTLLHNMHAPEQTQRRGCVTYNSDLLCMCCELLHNVCEVAVQHCPTELGRFLSAITSTLIPYVTQDRGDDVSRLCGRLLQLLLVDSAGSLKEAIRLLDPLPRVAFFTDARKICTKLKYQEGPFSLLQEVRHFLVVLEQGEEGVEGVEGRLEGLLFLHHQLSTHKEQLPSLCQDGDAVSPLVSLVYMLTQLSQSPHQRVAHEAGRCLAEIGPTDLHTVAIKGQSHKMALSVALSLYDDDQSQQRYCEIFHLLDDYLNDSSIEVVCAASEVLKAMLATQTGVSFHLDYKGRVKDCLFQYLHPFKPARKKATLASVVDASDEHFVKTVDDDLLWVPDDTNHTTWVTRLVCQLIHSRGVHDELLRLLTPVCKVKARFCEVVLPFLIHDILLHGNKTHRDVLSRQTGRFFEQHCGTLLKPPSRPPTPRTPPDPQEGECICSNKDSVRVMLNVIQYLRLQARHLTGRTQSTPWDNNWWLEVDYVQVAKAAQSCSAYFTTLLYSEIWCDTHRDSDKSVSPPSSSSRQNSPSGGSQGSQLETLSALSDEGTVNVQELMLEAYRAIGDPDGIYGCGAGRLADTAARIQTYEHENDWSKALCSYDLQLSQTTASGDQANLLQALQNFGTSHVLDLYLVGVSSQCGLQSRDVEDFQFRAACRNANWNIKVPTRLEPACSYDKGVYTGLCALRERDTATAMAAFKLARVAVLRSLGVISMESTRSLYPALSRLQCITELEDFTSCLTGDGPEMDQDQLDRVRLDRTLSKWSVQSSVVHNDYEFIEPIVSQRCVLLRLLLDQCPAASDHLQDGLLTQLCELTRLARHAGRHQVAERAVHQLRHLAEAMAEERWAWRIEEARMFWARGEHNTAKYLMRTIIDKLEKGRANLDTFYPECLGIYGDWLAETCSEAPNMIMEKYLEKAVTLLEDQGSADGAVLDAFLSLARYADGQYQHIIEYTRSGAFEAKQALIRQAREEADQLKSVGEKTGDMSQTDNMSRYLRTLEKQRVLDEQELESMMADRGRFLLCALSNYLKCLQFGDRHDMRVFRVTSLWFDNASQSEINDTMQKGADQIKSCKFLPLMYQLAARMGVAQPHNPSLFYSTLNSLIERVVLDHPHHSLFIILALANANKDSDVGSEKSTGRRSKLSKSSNSEEEPEAQQGRMQAAVNMLERLRQSRRADILRDMENLCDAYIQLANWDVSRYKTETSAIKLPSGALLTKLNNLETVAMPTLTTKVDPTGAYTDVVYIKSFESTFKLAGGINLPKIITCLGSDGISRRQLVKGKDDLRQDAVMQQVFEMVNDLLQRDTESSRRHLKVRTYKVVPLSQRSGLLEWCEGTIPLGSYLCGSANGAHERYRPQDLTSRECRKRMMTAVEKNYKRKHEAYLSLCDKFRPVFRHFFMERFPEPGDWYEKRLAYTRSVATNSIVGYIVGLGDRHVQNILIDCKSAELVHIDLGVAFEQGKILPTPETVPFRLTRDIVDGMGVAGVNGVFRRCCEKTMEVMHQSHEAVLTILEVLLYDPLYVWTMSPQRACQLQQWRETRADVTATDVSELAPSGVVVSDTDEQQRQSDEGRDVNKVAERALLRVRQKLQGLEDSVQLSVSGQVNQLIQAALDPKNLCRLFPGWQPYI